jgi:hypothetical protein
MTHKKANNKDKISEIDAVLNLLQYQDRKDRFEKTLAVTKKQAENNWSISADTADADSSNLLGFLAGTMETITGLISKLPALADDFSSVDAVAARTSMETVEKPLNRWHLKIAKPESNHSTLLVFSLEEASHDRADPDITVFVDGKEADFETERLGLGYFQIKVAATDLEKYEINALDDDSYFVFLETIEFGDPTSSEKGESSGRNTDIVTSMTSYTAAEERTGEPANQKPMRLVAKEMIFDAESKENPADQKDTESPDGEDFDAKIGSFDTPLGKAQIHVLGDDIILEIAADGASTLTVDDDRFELERMSAHPNCYRVLGLTFLKFLKKFDLQQDP